MANVVKKCYSKVGFFTYFALQGCSLVIFY